MMTATITRPLCLAGVPAKDWAFGIPRIWIAIVVALAASFWLELEVPSSAALTVVILALPTRGQALDKAVYRSIATLVGVTAALVIIGVFSQARDLLLAALAGWIGLCVYAAGLMDGTRAYAAVLSGYTVALVGIQQLDTPEHVFESGVARGAAIAIGIVAIAVVNDVFAAPDNHPQLVSRLAVLHGRVRDYAKAAFLNAPGDAAAAAGLLRDVAALHPDLTSLAGESSSGGVRVAAARSTAVALVAAVSAGPRPESPVPEADPAAASREFARRDAQVRDSCRVECGHSAAMHLARAALLFAADRRGGRHPSGHMPCVGGGLPRPGRVGPRRTPRCRRSRSSLGWARPRQIPTASP